MEGTGHHLKPFVYSWFAGVLWDSSACGFILGGIAGRQGLGGLDDGDVGSILFSQYQYQFFL